MPFGTRVPYTILNKKRPGHTFSVHIVPLFGALIWPQNQFLHNCASAKIKFDTPKERKKFISVHLNNEKKNLKIQQYLRELRPLQVRVKKTKKKIFDEKMPLN